MKPTSMVELQRAIIHGAVMRVRPKAMTAAVILAGLLPIMLGSGTGSEVMRRIAAPMLGGMITAPLVSMVLIPAIYVLWKGRGFVIKGNQHASVSNSATRFDWRSLIPSKKKTTNKWDKLSK
jgi:hypothetical protein